jgi:hypothetical protein
MTTLDLIVFGILFVVAFSSGYVYGYRDGLRKAVELGEEKP